MNKSDVILGAGLSNSQHSKPTHAQIRKKTHQRVVAQDPHNFSSYVDPRSRRLGLAERRRGNAHSLEEFVARTLLARQRIDVDDIVLCGDADSVVLSSEGEASWRGSSREGSWFSMLNQQPSPTSTMVLAVSRPVSPSLGITVKSLPFV